MFDFREAQVRRSFSLCLALAALSSCAPPPPLPVIEAGRVGDVAVGDTLQALEAAYAEDRRRVVDLQLEGMPAPAVEVMPPGTQQPDALVAELIEQDGVRRVYRIQVRDPLIETRQGVGVGDTVGVLRASHPPDRLIGGEGNVGLRVDALGATFLLDRDRVRAEWRRTNDAQAVPDDVTIRRILLTCPWPRCAPSVGRGSEETAAAENVEGFVADGWETFSDAARGVAFNYPPDLGTEYIHAVDWPPQLNVESGPFTCTEAGTATARAGRTEPRTIGGRTYCVTRVMEGAAGSV